MMDLNYSGILIVPLIIGIIEIFKNFGIRNEVIPLIAIGLGLAFGIPLFSNGDIMQGVVIGLAMGLSSVGLYSGSTNTKEMLLKK